ncbi:MAG TPA: alpha/beta hydrolase [Solirubrobacteraceae bacterium]|jgi:alpha-beta hydrolase superfamily lysophospholipase|nr:alpha/beta hydrolase [Solirubrobacteraceae bacterium]
MERTESELDGVRGRIVVHAWRDGDPRFVVLLAHGYGEHAGRYEHVARRLVAEGAAVYAPDHLGHGKSEGERAHVDDGEDYSADLHRVAERARAAHPGLPVVVLGHSMGGLIATRYAQKHPGELDALVLSGPAIGGNPALEMLLGLDPIPDVPVDPDVLSRDAAVGRAYADDPLVWHGPFKRSTLQALVRGVEAVAAGPPLGDVPTLWIHGEEDQLVPLAVTREAIARVRGERFEERVYAGARHEVFNETNKEEVLDDVVAFIHRALAG